MATAPMVEVSVSPWVSEFAEGMVRAVDEWENLRPGKPVNYVFILRCVQQFAVRFGVRVRPC